MEQTLCRIISSTRLTPDVCLIWLEAPGIARSVQPGQFVTVRCDDLTLRRPLSVHQVGGDSVVAGPDAIEAKRSQIALLFRIEGKGTQWLSEREPDEMIDVLGPLGNGFSLPTLTGGQKARAESGHLLLAAGGMGIAPLVLLAQRASSRHRVTLIHGAGTAAEVYPFEHAEAASAPPTGSVTPSRMRPGLLPSLPEGVQFVPVTEDGSMGRKGMVTDVLPNFLDGADLIYACGPVEMYRSMADLIRRSGWAGKWMDITDGKGREGSRPGRCQVSLEVRMGCGFGACYACTINTKRGLKQVCRDGPVFELDDIIWQEVRI
jgi:dihydroorotate dehydrogenase electron transfer subunit